MSSFTDSKLERYIRKIEDAVDLSTKVEYYKKAKTRISELELEYSKATDILTNHDLSVIPKKIRKMNTDQLLELMDKETSKLSDISINVGDLASIYANICAVSKHMQDIASDAENEIFKVAEDNNKIKIKRITLDDLI